jgi:lipoprotein-releasing system permease protein
MKHLRTALLQASIALAVAIGLARLFAFIPNGTRAQALGACIASFSFMASGFVVGVLARRRLASGKDMLELSALDVVDWLSVLYATIILAITGVIGFFTPAFTFVLDGDLLAPSGIARTIFATYFVVIPALILLGIGWLLGAGARRWSLLTALLGFIAFELVLIEGWALAHYASYDIEVVRIYALAIGIIAALVIGFIVSWVRRRLAFGELVMLALLFGYSSYFYVAAGPKELIAQTSLPEEQVFLAMAFAPTIAILIALVVGASFGYVLHGGGRFDPGFKYETEIAIRHLKTLQRPMTWRDHLTLLACFVLNVPIGLFLAVFVMRKHSAISVVAVISVLGVATGVMALIVVLSVMSGFEEDLKSKILGAHAHIVLEKTGDDFYEYADVEARVQDLEGVSSAAAYILGDGMISSDIGLSGTLVKGIDPNNERATADLRNGVVHKEGSGSFEHLLKPELIPGARMRYELEETTTSTRVDGAKPVLRELPEGQAKILPGIIIGRELSKTLHAYVGDTVKLVSPVSEEIGPTGPQPKLRRFRVAAIFYSGMYEYDAKFTYVDMKQAQSFFGLRKKASGVEIKVGDVDDTSRIVEEMKRRVGGYPYKVKDWREMNKELFSALLLEKLVMFIILTFIILVASFNIVATLIMIVLEKGKEIAILKSLGSSDSSIMKIFVVQGLIVGVGGALLGLFGGVGICAFIAKFGVDLDPKVFYIERLPVAMSWGEIAAIGIAAVVISYLATIYPAITAAQLRPVEGLRDD